MVAAKPTAPKAPKPVRKPSEPKVAPAAPRVFPIVGLGASAGGLEAFEQFFRHVPADSGMAFVVVSHLDPQHTSMLAEILQRSTAVPVVEVVDGMMVLPDQVHVVPPNREMLLEKGALRLRPPEGNRGQRMPIDTFLRSLAAEQGERAICVILSGTGSDGTLGARAIHGAGGVAFVQEPGSARYDGMPASAIRNAFATRVLPVADMPQQILAYVRAVPYGRASLALGASTPEPSLTDILSLVRARTGHDFTRYKQNTIRRRIERRMIAHGIDTTIEYARYLADHPDEVQFLFSELLINVTSFFRDPLVFETLKAEVLLPLLKGKPDDYVFRVWVVGCSTGEEAYSIAMVMREVLGDLRQHLKLQIYATDLDEEVISIARAGEYPSNIAADVSPERLRHFFVKTQGGYRVKKDLRDGVVFAVQNVIKDPPFTRLDLISCRNLLIYLEPELQNHIIPSFHYALKPQGLLMLSPSESIGSHSELFASINRKWKLYQAKSSVNSTRAVIGTGLLWTRTPAAAKTEEGHPQAGHTNLAELTRRVLLQSYAPASVITDAQGNVLFVHGDTGRYLRPAPGLPSLNVLEMARDRLAVELRSAIQAASTNSAVVVCRGVSVTVDDVTFGVDATVRPLAALDDTRGMLLISFQDAASVGPRKRPRATVASARGEAARVDDLERELLYAKENLQATIEEMQASNEEIKSSNEELQSMNEELQSTNEELETSKEELQSVNEELVTVNAELQAKIEQMTAVESDLKNLFDSTNLATIFLDDNLRLKRFTRSATAVYRLVSTDIGRPLADIKSSFTRSEAVTEDAQAVLDSLAVRERALETSGGEQYVLRIQPYRSLDNVIEGVVLTFSDMTSVKTAQREAQSARIFAESVVDAVREPLLVLDSQLRVVSAGRSFYRVFGTSADKTVGVPLFELGDRQWDIPRLRELLEGALERGTSFDDLVVEHVFPVIGFRRMLLNARIIAGSPPQDRLVLLALDDAIYGPVTQEQRTTK